MQFTDDKDITVENLQKFKNYTIKYSGECQCDCGDVHTVDSGTIIFGTLEEAQKIAKEKGGKIV